MARFCAQCGSPLGGTAQFCGTCGAQTLAAPAPAPEPAQPPPAQAFAPKRGHRLLIGLTSLVLVAGAGTATALVLTNDDGSDGGSSAGPGGGDGPVVRPAAIDEGRSVLGEPDDSWTLFADDELSGSTTTALLDGDFPTYTVTHGDVVVTQVETEDESVVLGVDATDGDVVWRLSGPGYGQSCWGIDDDAALLCTHYEDDGAYTVVDVETGAVRTQASVDGFVTEVVSDRRSTYLFVGSPDFDDYSLEAIALDNESLARNWSTTLLAQVPYDEEDPNAYDGGVQPELGTTELSLTYGPSFYRLDPATGAIREQGPVDYDDYATVDGYRIDTDYDYDPELTTVYDDQGNTLLSATGGTWSGGQDYSGVQNGLVGIGDTLYDLATGSSRWDRSDLLVYDEYGSSNFWAWTDEPGFVVVDDGGDYDDPGATLLDGSTGDTITHVEGYLSSDNSAFTDDAVITADDFAVVSVTSLEGALAWDRSLPEVYGGEDEGGWGDVVVSRNAVVVVGTDGLAGFTGFTGTASGDGSDEASDDEGDDDDGTGDGGTSYATDCGSEPELTPVEAEAANGGVTITFELTAVCPSGQWLSADTQLVTVTGAPGGSDQVLASGTFDFSYQPYWVPPSDEGSVTVPLTFPIEAAYATPDEINAAIAGQVIHVDCVRDPAAESGEVPADPDYGTPYDVPASAVGTGLPAEESAESALDALTRIAAADEPRAESDLEGWWMPQLSSKQEGTQDDGIVYTYDDILAEHLRLRLRYPDVRLVFSSDWKSFLVPGYWVTLVGDTSARPRPALSWCDTNGFTVDHCYAKRLLRDGPPEGSTRHRG